MPRESSQRKMGAAKSEPVAEVGIHPPKMTEVVEMRMIWAPIRPMVGMMRGTSRLRYMT
jgi:hypothetical protein